MTITYILQVLEAVRSGHETPEHLAIRDLDGELKKAQRRIRRRILRLKNRAQYEVGEMDRAKVAATSGNMEKFTKLLSKIYNFKFSDCTGLPGIEEFFKEGFKIDDMIARADKIAGMESRSVLAYSPMILASGILDNYGLPPEVRIDNRKYLAGDKEYIASLIQEIRESQEKVRAATERFTEISIKAREEAEELNDLTDYFVDGIEDLRNIIEHKGGDWNRYTGPEKMQVARSIEVAQLIALLFPHLLNDKVEVSEESRENIERAKKALSFRDA